MERFFEEFEVTMKEYLHTRARKNEATVETGRHNDMAVGTNPTKQLSFGIMQSRNNRNVPLASGSGGSRAQPPSTLNARNQNSASRQMENKENASEGGRSRAETEQCTAISPMLTKRLQDWGSRFPVKQEGDKWTRSLFDYNEIYQGGQEFQIEELRARLPKYAVSRPKPDPRKDSSRSLEMHSNDDGRDTNRHEEDDTKHGIQGNSAACRNKGKGRQEDPLTWDRENLESPPPSDLRANTAQKMGSYSKEDNNNVCDSDEEYFGTSNSPTMHTAFAADRMNKLFSHDTNLSAEQIFGTPWGEDETEDLGRDELDNFTMAYSIPTRALANTAEYSIPSLGFSNADELDGPPVEIGSDEEIDLTSITLAIQAMKRKNMDRGSQEYQSNSGKMRSRLERELERQRFEAEAGPSDITLDLRHQRQLMQEQQKESREVTDSLPLELNVPMLHDEAPPPSLQSHEGTA